MIVAQTPLTGAARYPDMLTYSSDVHTFVEGCNRMCTRPR